MPEIRQRIVDPVAVARLTSQGVDPVLARVYAARGVSDLAEIHGKLLDLSSFREMKGALDAAEILADAISSKKHIVIVADYDSDGATSCAVGLLALRQFGARVDYMVPNRFVHGYGLTPSIVEEVQSKYHPDFILTVDNGIASVEGVMRAHDLGIQVVVTDHHLPGDALPAAAAIVNPNQPGDTFASKNLAGVGVIFYVMMALRSVLVSRGVFTRESAPKLVGLLDLVALGTVADVVKLDGINRILVNEGLARIRAGGARPGVKALFDVAGQQTHKASASDFGFKLGPRINAAGRLDDMSIGISCLISESGDAAKSIAKSLDELNKARRGIESTMKDEALTDLSAFNPEDNYSLVAYNKGWHEGVVGIVASRLKDAFHRPTFVFAESESGALKGSGRSIPGLHLRDALDMVSKLHPDVLVKFGGHAMAAGATIRAGSLPEFQAAFEAACRSLLDKADLLKTLETDGPLAASEITLDLALAIRNSVWGQGFPEPIFEGYFNVLAQKLVGGGKHLSLTLEAGGKQFKSIKFFEEVLLPAGGVKAVFNIAVDDYREPQPQLLVQYLEPA
jgi:single-stranded-DNA-specific exonuclease